MGDRGNIVIVDDESKRVFFYTHWHGSEILETAHATLARKERWTDAPYLARMVFCELVSSDPKGETGYGISSGVIDNEHPVLVIDSGQQRVWLEDDKGNTMDGTKSFTFEEFIVNPPPTWKDMGVTG